jgi:hypothetical protein
MTDWRFAGLEAATQENDFFPFHQKAEMSNIWQFDYCT